MQDKLEDFERIKKHIKNNDTSFTIPLRYRAFSCCLCNQEAKGVGNHPFPIKKEGKCCDECYANIVQKKEGC